MLRTLVAALDQASAGAAGYTFVDEGGERPCAYADLRRRARAVAAALRRAGLVRGDVVALVLADAEPFLTTLAGAAIAGLVPASLNPPAARADLPRFLESTARTIAAAGARALIAPRTLIDALAGLSAPGDPAWRPLAWEDLCGDPPDAAVVDGWTPSLDDVAFVQYTSGSTSSPKGVVISHRNLAANIDGIYGPAGLAVTAADVGVSWLPLNHDMGLVGMALGPLYGARPAVILRTELFVKRPVEWLRAIARHRATISYAPNFAYDLCVRRVKDRDLDGLDLSSWRVAGCGAEPVNAQTLEAFARKFARAGFRASSFLPSYGLAEHVLAATFGERGRAPRIDAVSAEALGLARTAEDAGAGDAVVRLVSCGRPLPGHALRIVRDDGGEAREREVGEIVLAGPSVMLGYYKDPEMTAYAIRDGWLHTGDLGYVSGGELFVCGRLKDLIVVNGRNYHPQDLEWGVEGLAGVRRGRVVAFGAERHGDPGVVIVAESTGTVDAETLAGEIRRLIGDLFGLAVADVVLVPGGTIGRTTSGKVQRAAVRGSYQRGELPPTVHAAGLSA